MPSFDRHIDRLEFIIDDPLAVEDLSVTKRVADFFSYYIGSFVKAFHDASKDFASSELSEFNRRYRLTMREVYEHRDRIDLHHTIVPTPRTMSGTYDKTLTSLLEVISHIRAETLLQELEAMTRFLKDPTTRYPDVLNYEKRDFDRDKSHIGSLFGKTGAGAKVGSDAFSDGFKSIREVNDTLLSVVDKEYTRVVSINNELKEIEKSHDDSTLTGGNRGRLPSTLLSLAWRLSIYAICLEHIQVIEHNFTETLKKLRELARRA